MIDGYWCACREKIRIERMERANSFNDMDRFKAFKTEHGKMVYLEEHNVFRNPRDAAISLTNYLIAKAKVRSTELDILISAAKQLIDDHGLEDALYLAPIQVV